MRSFQHLNFLTALNAFCQEKEMKDISKFQRKLWGFDYNCIRFWSGFYEKYQVLIVTDFTEINFRSYAPNIKAYLPWTWQGSANAHLYIPKYTHTHAHTHTCLYIAKIKNICIHQNSIHLFSSISILVMTTHFVSLLFCLQGLERVPVRSTSSMATALWLIRTRLRLSVSSQAGVHWVSSPGTRDAAGSRHLGTSCRSAMLLDGALHHCSQHSALSSWQPHNTQRSMPFYC